MQAANADMHAAEKQGHAATTRAAQLQEELTAVHEEVKQHVHSADVHEKTLADVTAELQVPVNQLDTHVAN